MEKIFPNESLRNYMWDHLTVDWLDIIMHKHLIYTQAQVKMVSQKL